MRALTWSWTAAGLVLPLLAWPPAGSSPPADGGDIAGTFNVTYSNRQVSEIPETQGRVLMLTQARGVNRSTGPTSYMDGAEVTNSEIADLVRGIGPHQGYATFVGDRGSTVVKWNGSVNTTMSAGNQPATTFAGTWKFVSGTGDYSGIEGDGTYEGRVNSEAEYMVNWKGRYAN